MLTWILKSQYLQRNCKHEGKYRKTWRHGEFQIIAFLRTLIFKSFSLEKKNVLLHPLNFFVSTFPSFRFSLLPSGMTFYLTRVSLLPGLFNDGVSNLCCSDLIRETLIDNNTNSMLADCDFTVEADDADDAKDLWWSFT